MAPNKRSRDRLRNPEPFLPEEDNTMPNKQHSKARKRHHQEDEMLLSSGMSSKIFREARIQQKENEIEARNQLHANPFFELPDEELPRDDEDDIDDFNGFPETQTQIGTYEQEDIAEEDERLVEAFLSKDVGPQHTLADLIVRKIKENDAIVSSGLDAQPLPKLDTSVIDLYKGVGKSLNKYMAGKIPKAFKRIPSMSLWEEVLYLTEPENWSPNAMFQATRIFASNLGVKKVEKFYKLVLLPAVRKDIQKNKRLHFALYQALKKSLYKPTAFFKGILLPLCERERWQKPILRRLQPPPPVNDTNPYNVFRPREKAHRLHTRRMQRRENNVQSFEKLRQVRRNLEQAKTLLEALIKREEKKRDLMESEVGLQRVHLKYKHETELLEESLALPRFLPFSCKFGSSEDEFVELDDIAPSRPPRIRTSGSFMEANTIMLPAESMKQEYRQQLPHGWLQKMDPLEPVLLFAKPLVAEKLAAAAIVPPSESSTRNSVSMGSHKFRGRIGRGGRIIFDRWNPLLQTAIDCSNSYYSQPKQAHLASN